MGGWAKVKNREVDPDRFAVTSSMSFACIRMVMQSRCAWLLGLFLALVWGLPGCDGDKAPPPRAKPRLVVMASVYALADLARQVGGDSVTVDWGLEGGQNLDDYDASLETRQRFRRGQVVVSGGIGEEWSVEGSDDPTRAKQIVRLDLLPKGRDLGQHGVRQLWLDPDIACEALTAIADAYALQRPEKSNEFHDRARQLADQIQNVTREFGPKLESVTGRKVLVFTKDFSALSKKFGLKEIDVPGDSPLKVDADAIQAIRKTIREQSPVAMLIDVNTPLPVQQSLAKRIDLPLVGLEAQGTSAGVGRNSYLAILRYDLEQLAALPAAKL
jgi:zinc transport system substrate-binding protein